MDLQRINAFLMETFEIPRMEVVPPYMRLAERLPQRRAETDARRLRDVNRNEEILHLPGLYLSMPSSDSRARMRAPTDSKEWFRCRSAKPASARARASSGRS